MSTDLVHADRDELCERLVEEDQLQPSADEAEQTPERAAPHVRRWKDVFVAEREPPERVERADAGLHSELRVADEHERLARRGSLGRDGKGRGGESQEDGCLRERSTST